MMAVSILYEEKRWHYNVMFAKKIQKFCEKCNMQNSEEVKSWQVKFLVVNLTNNAW